MREGRGVMSEGRGVMSEGESSKKEFEFESRSLYVSRRGAEDFGVRGSAPIIKLRADFAIFGSFAAKTTALLALLFFVAEKLLLHLSTSTRLKVLNRAKHEERAETR